jgi:hypothetical protein
MAERRAVLIDELAADPRTGGRAPTRVGPTVALPMLSDVAADGVLFLCRAAGAAQFDGLDLEMVLSYASHAALVLQLARARHDNEVLRDGR